MKQKLLFLLALGCLIGANAQTKKVQTETKTINILNNDCKETTSYYYDDEDHKILHGNYSLKCATNRDGYQFNRNESVGFIDGELNGPYSYSYILLNKRQIAMPVGNGYYYKDFLFVDKKDDKVTGFYNMGKAHGTWKFSYKDFSSIGNKTTENKKGSITVKMDNGKLVGVEFSNGEKYTITYRYDSVDSCTYRYVSGKTNKYIAKNNIINSHFVRLKSNEISPLDDPQIKAQIDTITKRSYSYYQLLDQGYRFVEISTPNALPYNTDLTSSYLLCNNFLYDYYDHMGDYAKPMYDQAVPQNDFGYYILHRVKLLSLEEGKSIVDQYIDTYLDIKWFSTLYTSMEMLKSTSINPSNHFEGFSSSTMEQLKPYIDERVKEAKEEEEKQIAEEKRKEEERLAEIKRKEEERLAEIKRKEEEKKIAEQRYDLYRAKKDSVKAFNNAYCPLLFINYKSTTFIPNEGLIPLLEKLKAGKTYAYIAISELKAFDIIDTYKTEGTVTDKDIASLNKLLLFYRLFEVCCFESTKKDAIETNAEKIKDKCIKPTKDVYDAYKKIHSKLTFSKLFSSLRQLSSYAEKLDEHIVLQGQCLNFIALRNEMAQYDASIMDSKAKYIKKLYEEYYENADKAWTPDATVEKLTPIIETMKKVLSIVRRDDIKDFDKQIKKAKISTLEEVIRMSE